MGEARNDLTTDAHRWTQKQYYKTKILQIVQNKWPIENNIS
jgi:hypothetical protein